MYDATEYKPDAHARKWAAFCHLGGLLWFTSIPLSVIATFILWRTARHDHPYIDQQGREALNYQISLTLYNLVVGAMMWVLSWILFGWLLALLAAVLLIAEVAGCVYAAHQAHQGEPFRYPLMIRLL